MGLGEQLAALVESARPGGDGSATGFGRFLMSVGSGIADALVVIFGGIFLAAQPQFLPHRSDQAGAAGQARAWSPRR